MKIQLNECTLELPEQCNIEQLLAHLNQPSSGCAVAVNQRIISRSKWVEYSLNESDQVSLFQAIAGG